MWVVNHHMGLQVAELHGSVCGAETAVKLAQRKPIIATGAINNGSVDVPAILYKVLTVHKDNLCETVIADGFQDFDKVYQSVPADKRPAKPAIVKH